MAFMDALITAVLIGVGFTLYIYLVEPYMIRVTRIEIPFPDLPPSLDGLTICHLSDIHATRITKLEALIGRALADIDADLCVVTGDIISGRDGLTALPLIFSEFKPRLGTYAVTGNGEYKTGIPIQDIADALGRVGVRLLRNESTSVCDGTLQIIGVEDPHRRRDDLAKAEEGATRDGFRLLLAHSPDILVKVHQDSADLILAGHTHGGQVRLPFVGALWLHTHERLGIAMGYFDPKALSTILKRDLPRTHLYVSRGLGGSGIRARFMCPPEIAILTLRRR